MRVRLLDADTDADITATGGPGVPAGNGPTLCLGYWDDAIANEQLFTADGWMRMGDLATIDGNGYISRMGAAGMVTDSAFIKGLNAPKGMALVHDTLWVGDIDVVRAYNARTGAPVGEAVAASTADDVDRVVTAAAAAMTTWSGLPSARRAEVLDRLAAALDEAADALVSLADKETALGEARLRGEVGRTTGQLRMTTVSLKRDVTLFGAFGLWVSGRYALAPREEYIKPGQTEDDE